MKRNIFRVIGLLVVFLFVTFFSVKVDAASFKYSDFDWDEFASKNKTFWVSSCETSKDPNCVDRVLATKKKFYTQLYKLLAKVQSQYPSQKLIDDNIIIATVFYGLDSDSFRDPIDNESNPYNLDANDDDSTYLGEVDESAKEYFKNETNSLKTLINAFIGYKTTCYTETEETPSNDTCSSGKTLIDNKCVIVIDDTLKSNFWDKLGLNFDSDSAKNRCSSLAKEKGYNNSNIKVNSDKEVNEEFYWDFLENTNYLDNKSHLQDYYISVLAKTKYKTMKELEADTTTYEKYNEEIKEVRRRIIKGIKEVLEYYKGISDQYNKMCSDGYLWPIGSSNVSDSDGKQIAIEEPETTSITSQFGKRTHPMSGKERNHNGIDIGATRGTTNVIAVKNGVISKVVTGCIEGNTSCGGGYGNHIIIEHQDGNYTLYAHLYEDSVMVNEGDSVIAGQVIAKVGSTGSSTGPHLHFEVRVGGQESSSVQDPLNFVSQSSPRSSGGTCSSGGTAGSEFLKMLHYFEGGCSAKTSGNNYVVDDDGYGIPTVGYGVALKYNIENFKKYGIDVNGMSFGSLIPIDIVDKVESDEVNSFSESVKNKLSKEEVTLEQYQIDCLIMISYQFGNIGNFPKMYKQYGNTDTLRDVVYSISGGKPSWHYFKSNPSTQNGRAEATWNLFHNGKYTYSDNC